MPSIIITEANKEIFIKTTSKKTALQKKVIINLSAAYLTHKWQRIMQSCKKYSFIITVIVFI